MTIFAVLFVLMLLLATMPLRVTGGADGGSAAVDSGDDGGDALPAGDDSPVSDGDDGAGGVTPPPAPEPDGKPADLAGRAWESVRSGKPIAGKPDAAAAPPQAPGGEILKLAEELRIAPESLAKIPAEHHAAFLGEIDRWRNQIYMPAAKYVAQLHGQLDEFNRAAQAFVASPPYQVAEALYSDPELLDAIQAYLSGQSAAPDPRAELLAKINPDELDETSRAMWELNQQSLQRQQALEQQLAEMRGQVGQLGGRWQRYDQEQQKRVQEMAAQVATDTMARADQAAAAHFGFDPKRHKAEYAKAEKLLYRQLAAEGLAPDADLGKMWLECLQLAGFDRIAAQRKRAAKTSAGAPPDRAGAGGGGDNLAARAWAEARSAPAY